MIFFKWPDLWEDLPAPLSFKATPEWELSVRYQPELTSPSSSVCEPSLGFSSSAGWSLGNHHEAIGVNWGRDVSQGNGRVIPGVGVIFHAVYLGLCAYSSTVSRVPLISFSSTLLLGPPNLELGDLRASSSWWPILDTRSHDVPWWGTQTIYQGLVVCQELHFEWGIVLCSKWHGIIWEP